ncbi:efflux RND transporter permease subunit [Sinomicrobium sp.]
MIKKIIERPVFTLVISILLLIAGVYSISKLPVERFPEIAPPSVSVSVYYPGANSETLAKSVLLPLEEAINGAENMEYINSTATNSGSGRVTVYFKPGSDPDLAAVEVQNRVSEVTADLPLEVIENGIQVMKRMKGTLMTVNIFSDGTYDETFLNAYTRSNIRRAIKRVEGIARAQILRRRDYAMRIWLNPEKMAMYNLTPRDIYNQVRDQSFEAGPGKFGENSKEVFEIIIKHDGRFNEPEQYENIVIKTEEGGLQLKLKDIARIEFGASNYTSRNRLDGKPSVTMDITQQNGANAMEIDKAIRKVMEEQAKIFPDGMDYQITYSVRDAIDESMHHVQQTLIEAFILVFLVVFIFLQDVRITLITALTIPISLVGTFFFLQMIGVTMNVLSMFSMVLAIGIVVDDAIVVVEAIYEKMQHHQMTARQAVNSALSEITGAVISITIVIAAVFLPVGLIQGPVGVFYQEFAYTIVISVLLSAVVALTMGPMLFMLFYRKRDKKEKKKKLSAFYSHSKRLGKINSLKDKGLKKFDTLFEKFTKKYISVLRTAIKFKWASLAGLGVIIGLLVFLMSITPKGFIPTEDDNFLLYTISMPEGASLDRTNKALEQAAEILSKEEAVESVNTVSGFNIVDNSETPSSGLTYIKLKEKSERGEIQEVQELVRYLTEKLQVITDIRSMNMYPRPTVQGFGNFDGVQIMLQDLSDGDLGEFGQLVNEFIIELTNQKEIESAFTSYNPNFPQLKLNIDYEKANALGVSVKDMMFTLQSNFSRQRVTDLNRFTRQYMVYMQADTEFSESPETINSIFVRNDKGEMVPINTFVSLEPAFGPETINRYNLYNAAKINITPAAGYSTGDVMSKIEELGEEKLPASLSYEWTSMSLEEKKSGSDAMIVFIISFVLVYFILAAQYESFWLPMAVLLSLPTGILGVFVFINLAGIDNNIYVQVGILMLLGLLAKNAILIVEFAAQKRRAGIKLLDAVLEASALRIRAIVMTSLAFTVGLIPLMFSTGSSAIGNKSVSIGTAGGMLFNITLGIVVIPVLTYIFLSLQDRYFITTGDDDE